jgi:hypothetical protein
MLSPLDVAHSNYRRAIITLDTHLKFHTWEESRVCVITMPEPSWRVAHLEVILERYRALGWEVQDLPPACEGAGIRLQFTLRDEFQL